jgi:gas vesicle protein
MSREQWGSFGLGVLVGAVVGGVLALLFAPESGKETRQLIRDKSGEYYEVVKTKIGNVRQTVGDKISGREEVEN